MKPKKTTEQFYSLVLKFKDTFNFDTDLSDLNIPDELIHDNITKLLEANLKLLKEKGDLVNTKIEMENKSVFKKIKSLIEKSDHIEVELISSSLCSTEEHLKNIDKKLQQSFLKVEHDIQTFILFKDNDKVKQYLLSRFPDVKISSSKITLKKFLEKELQHYSDYYIEFA